MEHLHEKSSAIVGVSEERCLRWKQFYMCKNGKFHRWVDPCPQRVFLGLDENSIAESCYDGGGGILGRFFHDLQSLLIAAADLRTSLLPINGSYPYCSTPPLPRYKRTATVSRRLKKLWAHLFVESNEPPSCSMTLPAPEGIFPRLKMRYWLKSYP